MSDASTLSRLQSWYSRQCDGVWEHTFGISIDTCDNPGWWVKVNLEGTKLQGQSFDELAENVDIERHAQGPSWFNCHVEGNIWHGAGDETQLERVLNAFLGWADERENASGKR